MTSIDKVAEFVAMGLALSVLCFYRFSVGVIVYDSEEVHGLVRAGNFEVDRNRGGKTKWEEWLLLQAVIRQLDICLSNNQEVRFRHKKFTQFAGDHAWPPQAACEESFNERATTLDNFFFPDLRNPSWEAVRVSRQCENQARIQWEQAGTDWIPRLNSFAAAP